MCDTENAADPKLIVGHFSCDSFLSKRPRRLARPRTSPFHGGNTGSNPVGDANIPKHFQDQAVFVHGPIQGQTRLSSMVRRPSQASPACSALRASAGPQPAGTHLSLLLDSGVAAAPEQPSDSPHLRSAASQGVPERVISHVLRHLLTKKSCASRRR